MMKIPEFPIKLYLGIAFSLVTPVLGQEQNPLFQTSEHQVRMLELFSTQSCSSCPPAQHWISNLKDHPKRDQTFVPIVFHVDYWDYLGWKDPYSSAKYTKRQRIYGTSWKIQSIYTPMFVLDGREYRKRRVSDLLKAGPKVGVLSATKLRDNRFQIRFMPTQHPGGEMQLNWAVRGHNISTKIKAGENEGKILKHDFITLSSGHVLLKKKGEGFVGSHKVVTPSDAPPEVDVVFWVTLKSDQKPIQVLQVPL